MLWAMLYRARGEAGGEQAEVHLLGKLNGI